MTYFHASDFATMESVLNCDIQPDDFLVVETIKNIDNKVTYQQFSTFKYIDMHQGNKGINSDCIYKVTFRGYI